MFGSILLFQWPNRGMVLSLTDETVQEPVLEQADSPLEEDTQLDQGTLNIVRCVCVTQGMRCSQFKRASIMLS